MNNHDPEKVPITKEGVPSDPLKTPLSKIGLSKRVCSLLRNSDVLMTNDEPTIEDLLNVSGIMWDMWAHYESYGTNNRVVDQVKRFLRKNHIDREFPPSLPEAVACGANAGEDQICIDDDFNEPVIDVDDIPFSIADGEHEAN